MTQQIHLISFAEPLMFDMISIVREKGYEVSVSGEGLSDDAIGRIREAGCTCYGEGWFPNNMSKDLSAVVLSATVKKDNPELLKAKQIGLLVQSIPEFIYQHTKSKTRVVVVGNPGKSNVLSLICYALQAKNINFDYFLSGRIGNMLPEQMKLTSESRIALIEGDEHFTAAIDKRFQLEFYRPHIAVLTSLLHTEGGMVEEVKIYKDFLASIERQGKLVYFSGDATICELAGNLREDITTFAYMPQEVVEEGGKTFIRNRYGTFPIRVQDEYFLANMAAARMACRQLGVNEVDFYNSISAYSLLPE